MSARPMESAESADNYSTLVGFQIRMKHGDLLKAMRDRNWTQTQLGEHLGISPQEVGSWINMRKIPRRASPAIRRKLEKLCGKKFTELFPLWLDDPEFLASSRTSEVYQELTPQMIEEARIGALPTPDEAFEAMDRENVIRKAVQSLTPRQQLVVTGRIEDRTFKEIGKELKISGGRAQQIYHDAIELLRQRVSRDGGELLEPPSDRPRISSRPLSFPALPPPRRSESPLKVVVTQAEIDEINERIEQRQLAREAAARIAEFGKTYTVVTIRNEQAVTRARTDAVLYGPTSKRVWFHADSAIEYALPRSQWGLDILNAKLMIEAALILKPW